MKALISYPPSRPSPLARAAFAELRAKVTGREVEEVVKAMSRGDDVMRVITRAPIDPATTTGSGWVDDLQQTTYGQYLGWLAPGSAAARLINLGLTVPMRGVEFTAPARDVAPVALPWVAEAGAIPVRSMTLQSVTLTPRKQAAISTFTREAAKYNGESVITSLLREDGEKSLDAAYFSTATGTATVHPGLLAGLSPIIGYSGGDKLAFEADIDALLSVVAPNGSGNIVFITGQYAAQRIALRFPDFRSPVFASQAVADTRLIAVDAGALVHSFGDYDVMLGDGVVHMEDTAPAADIGEATGDVRSLYQTDSLGLRIVGDIAFAARKASAVAYVDNMTW